MAEHKCTPLINRLSQFGLISESRCEKIQSALKPETTQAQLAVSLVKKKWLTTWQVDQLGAGREQFLVGDYLIEKPLPIDPTFPYERFAVRRRSDKKRFELVKLLSSSEEQNQELERLSRVRQAILQFSHPNIAAVVDFVETSDGLGIVSQHFKTNEISPKEISRIQALTWLRDLALCWSHAHSLSLYSPFLSSDSLSCDEQGKLCVLRFGMSLWHEHDSMGAERWQPLAISQQGSSPIANEVRQDLARLSQLGRWLLTGDPTPPKTEGQGSAAKDPVIALMDKLAPAGVPTKIETMSSVVKRLNKLLSLESPNADEKESNTSSPDSNAFPVIMERPEVDSEIVIRTEKETTFSLGPQVEVEEPIEDSELLKKDNKTKTWMKPVAILLALSFLGILFVGSVAAGAAWMLWPKSADDLENATNSSMQLASATEQTASLDEDQSPPTTAGEESDETNQGNDLPKTTPPLPELGSERNEGPTPDPTTPESDAANQGATDRQSMGEADSETEGTTPDSSEEEPSGGSSNDEEAAGTNSDSNPTEEMKEEPKPEPIAPLAEIPTYFELPDVGTAEEPATDYQKEVVVGKVNLTKYDLLFVKLLGGDKAFRGKTEFELKTLNDSPLAFRGEIAVKDRGSENKNRKPIATLRIDEGELRFAWLPDCLSGGPIDYLQNCAILLQTGTDSQAIALRYPIVIPPLTIAGTEAKGKTEVKLEFLPRPDVVRVQVLGLADDFPAYKFRDNGNSANATRGSIFLDFAGTEDSGLFGKLDLTNRTRLQVSYGTYVRMGNRFDTLNPAFLERKLNEAKQFVEGAQARIEFLDGLPEQQRNAALGQRQSLQAQLNQARREQTRLSSIINFANRFDGKQVPLRVYMDFGDHQIDLATPDGKPLPND